MLQGLLLCATFIAHSPGATLQNLSSAAN